MEWVFWTAIPHADLAVRALLPARAARLNPGPLRRDVTVADSWEFGQVRISHRLVQAVAMEVVPFNASVHLVVIPLEDVDALVPIIFTR